MMLRHSFGLEQEASDIELAIHDVLEAGYRTPDIAKARAVTSSRRASLAK
jgi:3-isopropylmalate dehydrogenase